MNSEAEESSEEPQSPQSQASQGDVEGLDLDFDDSIQSLDEYVTDWKASVKEAAEEALPKTVEHKPTQNKVSERTRHLFKKRDKMHPSKNTKEEFAALTKEIQESSIKDFKDWVNVCVTDMESANEQGNARRTFAVLKYHLLKASPRKPTGTSSRLQKKPLHSGNSYSVRNSTAPKLSGKKDRK